MAKGAGKGDPSGVGSPRVRVGSEAGLVACTEHKAVSMGVAAGAEHTKLHPWAGSKRGARGKAEHDVISMARKQARSTRLSGARSYIYRRFEGSPNGVLMMISILIK